MFNFWKKKAPDLAAQTAPDVDFGGGFVARQLCNGKWVLEKGGKAFDLKTPPFRWKAGRRFYSDCMASSFRELEGQVKDIMARQGL
jgi:hypothetical protein